jgi:alpha-galactosidase/6-phospho-beta-glucosidase family protein
MSGEEIIKISDELWKKIGKDIEDIEAARAGLDHFAFTLRIRQKSLLAIIIREIPEMNEWNFVFDHDTKTIIKKYKK